MKDPIAAVVDFRIPRLLKNSAKMSGFTGETFHLIPLHIMASLSNVVSDLRGGRPVADRSLMLSDSLFDRAASLTDI